MNTASPKDLGFDSNRLARVIDALDRDIAAERCDGAAVSIGRRGQTALHAARGFGERSSGRKLEADSVFATMSVGKQFTNVIVLERVERGALRLSMPVAELIPEFGSRGKGRMQLHHLLSHTSGLMSAIPPLPPDVLGNIERMAEFASTTVPESLPGERVTYCIALAHSVMAEMVSRVEGSKRSFRQILDEDLFRPLGMKDTSLGPRKDLLERMNPVVARYTTPGLFDPNAIQAVGALFSMPGAELPAGGYLTTISDLARFAEMLRRGGELDGKRILSPAMLEFATRNHTGDKPNTLYDYTIDFRGWERFPASIGLGFFVRGEGVIPGFFGNLCSARTFGGAGAGSTSFWVDPEHDVTFSLLTTGLMEDSFHMERTAALSDLVLSAIVE